MKIVVAWTPAQVAAVVKFFSEQQRGVPWPQDVLPTLRGSTVKLLSAGPWERTTLPTSPPPDGRGDPRATMQRAVRVRVDGKTHELVQLAYAGCDPSIAIDTDA